MAFTLVSSDAKNLKNTADNITFANVVAEAGDVIVLWLLNSWAAGFLSEVSWGTPGAPEFTEPVDTLLLSGTNSEMRCFMSEPLAAGTHDLVVQYDSNAIAAAAYQLCRGIAASPADQQVAFSGIGTAPATGLSGTLAQASEVQLAAIGTEGPVEDAAGTWGNSLTGDKRDGTTGGVASTNRTIATAFRELAATDPVTATKSGITSRVWGAMELTLKLAAEPILGGAGHQRLSLGLGIGL